MPLSTNSDTKPTTNSASDPTWLALHTIAAPTAMAAKFQKVMRAPPKRSASEPPSGRISEPSSGPSQVSDAAARGVAKSDVNWFCSTWPKANPKPMNEPKVPMYRNDMIQVCGSRVASRMARGWLRAVDRLSMSSAAPTAATTISGMYTTSTSRGCCTPAVASTSRPTSWTTGTPRLPPPALRPSAQPLSRFG
jgi:hypothetical protein